MLLTQLLECLNTMRNGSMSPSRCFRKHQYPRLSIRLLLAGHYNYGWYYNIEQKTTQSFCNCVCLIHVIIVYIYFSFMSIGQNSWRLFCDQILPRCSHNIWGVYDEH